MALAGVKVLELAGLAPTPFLGMVLADFGAKVIRIDKLNALSLDTMGRGKRSICVNMKKVEGVNVIKQLSQNSDVIIEPFRPGVMEKLGLGPDVLQSKNPRLVYVRLSGFGQTGPYKFKAGHDINYIATSGILSMLRRKDEKPTPPLNLIADFAGGGLLAAFGVVSALYERERSGKGQIIDLSMVEGSAYVSSFAYTAKQFFPNPSGENLLDTGAPFYDTYQTKDGCYVSVGALEPQFFRTLMKGLELDEEDILPHQMNKSKWSELRQKIKGAISSRTKAQLQHLFDDDNSCVMPVLSPDEAARNLHNRERNSFFVDAEGKNIPNPAPKLSRTPAYAERGAQPTVGAHTREVLAEYGFTSAEINKLISENAIEDNSLKSNL